MTTLFKSQKKFKTECILELEWAWKITVEPSSSFYDEFRASRAELEPSLSTRSYAIHYDTCKAKNRIVYSWPGCCHEPMIQLLQVIVTLLF